MTVRVGVVVFPGSNCDTDTVHGLELAGAEPVALWHESADLEGVAGVILPGGFAYGDYLRAGVIARFSPVMRSVAGFAADGGLVLGICNGFQVLAEAGLVPGRAAPQPRPAVPWPRRPHRPGASRHAVHAGAAGSSSPCACRSPTARAATTPTRRRSTRSRRDGQVLFRYVTPDGTPAWPTDDRANPNGSLRAIAGVINAAGNVAGLMPHPERASEAILGSDDGLLLLRSLVDSAAERERPAAAARGGGRRRMTVDR